MMAGRLQCPSGPNGSFFFFFGCENKTIDIDCL
jgi:hypothetical protein